MAFIKKKWVNVPDPSNPPSIPEGQDALARFDADNMNRIEDGIAKATEDLLKKAPAGHGLGGSSASHTGISFLDLLQEGSGFYTVGEAPDTPYKNGEWLGALQIVRQTMVDKETGLQLAFYDFSPNNPNVWIRASLRGEAGIWHEMLHTGNISNYANAKITTGSYVGVIGGDNPSEVVLSFDFPPKLIILQGETSADKEFTATFLHGCDGHYIIVGASNSVGSNTVSTIWEGNSVKIALTKYESDHLNWSGKTYSYVAIG